MANMFNKATLLLVALLLAVVATMPACAATNRVLLAEDGEHDHDHDHDGEEKTHCPEHGEDGHDHDEHHSGDCAENPMPGPMAADDLVETLDDAAGTIGSETESAAETVAPVSAGFSSAASAAVAAASAAAMAALAL